MDRRDFLRYSLALGATLTLGTKKSHAAFPWLRKGILPPGMFVVDAHAHPDQFYDPYPHDPDPDLSSSLEKITTLGMRGSNFAAVGDHQTDDGQGASFPWSYVMGQIKHVNDLEIGGSVKIVRSRDDVRQYLYQKGSIPAAILSLEGASPMGIVGAAAPGIDDGMNELFEKGVRMITVMHRGDNQFGTNMSYQGDDGPGLGLTDLGKQLVEKMIESGIIVDGAHAYYRTLMDMAKIARANGVPIIDSHTSLSPRSSPNGSRLRTWREMEIIASTGGLICTWPFQWESPELGVRRWTIRDWARENFEMKTRLGAKHIALGTDGGGQLPVMVNGYSSILDLPRLIAAMYMAGFQEWEIKLYMGGNFRRVLEACLPD
jgi:microsomal dipeptidase-like Zn-dependent dipeptidase